MSETNPFSHFSDKQFWNLNANLKRGEVAFQMLEESGHTSSTEVRIDFWFECPERAAADRLVAFLSDETDFELEVVEEDGVCVKGTTQLTPLTKQMLMEWTFWMCSAGANNGDCYFEGWGTTSPG